MHRFIATTRSTKLLLPKRLTTLHQQQQLQHNHYSNYYNNRDNNNNNSSSDLRNRETNDDEQHDDRRNNRRSGAYRFFTGLSALTGLSFFSYILYLNMYKDQHFNDSLTRNNTRSSPTSLVDDHPDFSSDHSSSLYNSVENEQLNQMKQFIWHVLRDNRDVIAVINQDNKTRIKQQQQQQRQQQQMNRGVGVVGVVGDDDDDAGEESTMERMAMLNQSDRNRDIDIMHVNAQSYQQRYHSHVSELFKLMNSIENTSRMRVLKKTNENRPLILLVDNVNAADNNVLDVLKVYARRWSRDPERFGVGIVFAGHTLRYRFKDDVGAKIWDFGTYQSNYLTGGGSGGGVSSLNENVVDPRDVAAGNYQTEGGYRDL